MLRLRQAADHDRVGLIGDGAGTRRMKFRFVDYELDEERLELRRQGSVVVLQPKPLAVLLRLLHSYPGVVSRDELLASVWEGLVVTDNSVSRAVRQLRLALDTPSGPVLRTVRGRGYGLAVPVEAGGLRSAGARAPVEPPGAFVGRGRELVQLGAALDAASRGAGRALVIVGQAGMGKTRLVQRFASEAEARGARVLWGACYAGVWSPRYGALAP
jgi:DNA-binding winged helix-turn-helix (wHTH) protein